MKTCPPWGLAKPRTVGGALVLLGLLSSCDRRHPLGPSFENFASVTAGNSHACGVTTGGLLYCWGSNADGQLGNGSTSDSPVPVRVSGGLTFSAVRAGDATTEGGHTCGLITGGEAYCWGSNRFGELGNGSNQSSLVPVPVTEGLTFSGVSAGDLHTCGLTTGGLLYCWGSDVYGQLGNGSTSDSPVPVLVTGGFRFSAVTTGHSYTCALTTGGAAYCWG